MANRLAKETSPYLLQHADNPVDWYPWGDEAFVEARSRDVPIFLSVGYSSCHWCHVMAHESFEDPDIAEVLNERFVNVKVDREERPDVDAVYMEAVQAMTGRGGWPMSAFLTPDGRPFYAGTYWPRQRRMGMPGFRDVVDGVHEAWTQRRGEILDSAERIMDAIAGRVRVDVADEVDLDVTDDAARLLVERAWDRDRGGFGRAPKFPQAMTIEYLLDRHARTGEDDVLEAAVHSLEAMARGGIHDQIGGGFHRYSVDEKWLVPHFEKMLYDNALLLAAYAKAAALTGRRRFGDTARSIADYLLGGMRHESGGFFSATDADSEGEEGRFFVWGHDEFHEVVSAAGADADLLAAFHGVTAQGNWEGSNILHEPVDREQFCRVRDLDPDAFEQDLARAHDALRERRAERIPPGLDDKVLTSWNALVIRGLVRAGLLLDEPRYVRAAAGTARFLRDELVVDGRLHHVWKDGAARIPAFLEDVAFLALAELDLYQATGESGWYEHALALAGDARARFHDPDGGGYYQTADDADDLYSRPRDMWDNAQPSGNSVLAEVFLRLYAYTADGTWGDAADEVLRAFQGAVRDFPTGYGYLLQAVEFATAGPREVAVVGAPGEDRAKLVRALWSRPRPGTVVAVAAPGDPAFDVVPLLEGRVEVDGRPAAYVCRTFTCQRPVTEPQALAAALADGA